MKKITREVAENIKQAGIVRLENGEFATYKVNDENGVNMDNGEITEYNFPEKTVYVYCDEVDGYQILTKEEFNNLDNQGFLEEIE